MRLIDADRLLDRCKFYHLPNGDLAVPIIDIQRAPTVEAPDINVGNVDTISRQQAIDEAERWLYDGDDKRTIGEMLRDLPSVQPDVIRCKDCRFYTAYDYTGKLMCKRIGKGMILPKIEDYCSYAERRTDG